MRVLNSASDVIKMLPDTLWRSNTIYLAGLLDAHYELPWRTYHNIDHVAAMIAIMRQYDPTMEHYDELAVAILFHDVIYDVRAYPGVNELESASFAIKFGERCFTHINWGVVQDLILVTRHKDIPKSPAATLICDLDLMGFSYSFDEFHEIGERIIAEYEYVHPKLTVLKGRRDFLTGFGQREKIFYTTRFSNETAFANIRRELTWLEAEIDKRQRGLV